MPQDKFELETQQNLAVVNLVNNVFADKDRNSEANDILALELNAFIGKLLSGDWSSRVEFAHLLNRAMELTKNDPQAAPGEFDELLQVSELINDTLKFPYLDVDFFIVLLQTFEGALLGSQRRHFSFIARFHSDVITEILKNYRVVKPHTATPPSFKSSQESSKPGRLSFLKGK